MKVNRKKFSMTVVTVLLVFMAFSIAHTTLRDSVDKTADEQSATNPSSDPQNKTGQQVASPNGNTSDSTSKPSNASTYQYLTIDEWSVVLSIAPSVSDAYYVPRAEPETPPSMMWLGVKSLDSIGHCKASKANEGERPLASIFRAGLNEKDPVSGQSYQEKYPDGTVIGDHYYAYNAKWIENFPCVEDANYSDRLDEINSAFRKAANGILKAESR